MGNIIVKFNLVFEQGPVRAERDTEFVLKIKSKENLDHSDADDIKADEGEVTPTNDRVVDNPSIGEIKSSHNDKTETNNDLQIFVKFHNSQGV